MKWGKCWVDRVAGTPWEREHIDYRALKKRVKALKQSLSGENDENKGADACNSFWSKVESEVEKVNAHSAAVRGRLAWVGAQRNDPDSTQGCGAEAALLDFVEINQTSLKKITKKALKKCPAVGAPSLEVDDAFPTGSASALGVCRALICPESELKLTACQVGAGQFAQVLALNGVFGVYLESGQVVREPMVLKFGTWRSRSHYRREVDLHKAAAEAGLSPRVFFESSSAEGARPYLGVIAMERLTGPTLLKWLMWQTKKLHLADAEQGKLPAWKRQENEQWAVDPRTAELPLVREWNAEARRIRKVLASERINHGDLHERNFVFDVPRARLSQLADAEQADYAESSSLEAADEKSMKRWLMSAVGEGVQGSARLLIIDFGRASSMGTSRASRLFHLLFKDGRRLADPSEESRSPPTPRPRRSRPPAPLGEADLGSSPLGRKP